MIPNPLLPQPHPHPTPIAGLIFVATPDRHYPESWKGPNWWSLPLIIVDWMPLVHVQATQLIWWVGLSWDFCIPQTNRSTQSQGELMTSQGGLTN